MNVGFRYSSCCFALLISLWVAPELPGQSPAPRSIPNYEADVYGPLPFPEEVTGFLHHELDYFLRRQNKDGSWDSAQPEGNGRSTMEAGGTVGNISLTSMCGYSLRHFEEYDPDRINDSVDRALRFVTQMVLDGKLRSNANDTTWQYIYALRFLVAEYPRSNDPTQKKNLQDACRLLVRGLQETQGGTFAEQSLPFPWTKRSNPGLIVGPQGKVTFCPESSPAYQAGLRVGDQLLTANKTPIDTAIRYALAELTWTGNQTLSFVISRKGSPKEITLKLPSQYPGTLGLNFGKNDLTIRSFQLLSNKDSAPLQAGDRIQKINGKAVSTPAELSKWNFVPGEAAELEIVRQDTTHQFTYTCAPVPAADFGVVFPNHLFDQSTEKGLRIAGFTRGSCLREAGLKTGDRLLRLDGSLIVNRKHFRDLARSLWGGKEVSVSYLSDGEVKETTVPAGTLSDQKWLLGFHGLSFSGNTLSAMQFNSPADLAGCQKGDKVIAVNGTTIDDRQSVKRLLHSFPAGRKVTLSVLREGQKKELTLTLNKNPETRWIVKAPEAGGGWGYLGGERGGNSFTTADAMRELLKTRKVIPELEVPDELISRAFVMLGKLRKKQPNSEVESYRYDTGGSFWRYQDIRADIGRLNSVELACLMYCDSDLNDGGDERTQQHLEKALREWLKHRGILDLVKFPKGHGELSIAPYFWMYSYRTTLEAADYLKTNDALKDEVQRIALKAFFKHMVFRYEEKLGEKGWIIGGDRNKELHDSCQLLDGLATIKHLYEPRRATPIPALEKVTQAFHQAKYGETLRLIESLDPKRKGHPETNKIREALYTRYQARIRELTRIHEKYPFDALRYLEETKPYFANSPAQDALEKLEREWRQDLPELPPWTELGEFPGETSEKTASAAWDKIMTLKQAAPAPSKWPKASDLLSRIDSKKQAVSGEWRQADNQLISPSKPYSRLQLPAAPKGSYRFEAQFTRLKGTCTTFMLPVGANTVTLVLGGWNGKVSGLAYLDGKDANRNETTRDGNYSANEKHTLQVEVRLLPNKQARVTVHLDGKAYLKWGGKQSSVNPDREWRLFKPGSIGIGSYESIIVFHSCQIEELR